MFPSFIVSMLQCFHEIEKPRITWDTGPRLLLSYQNLGISILRPPPHPKAKAYSPLASSAQPSN